MDITIDKWTDIDYGEVELQTFGEDEFVLVRVDADDNDGWDTVSDYDYLQVAMRRIAYLADLADLADQHSK